MADPCDGNLPVLQFGKDRLAALAVTRRKPGLPDHLVEKRSWIEVIARGQFFERPRYAASARR